MKILSLNQQSPEWHVWRNGGLGGSDIGPIVLGDDWPFPDSRAELLFARKTGVARPQPDDFVMRRGRFMEEGVRLWFMNTHVRGPFLCKPMCVQHNDVDWMRLSLDGAIYMESLSNPGNEFGFLSILEIKVPNWKAHDAALAGIVPAYYVPQVQYQLLVTGLDALDYVSYSVNGRYGDKDKYAVVRVSPDAELQAEIVEKCETFWNRVQEARHAKHRGTHEYAGV